MAPNVFAFTGMFLVSLLAPICGWTHEELVNLPGHMKEFGYSETEVPVVETDKFPFTRHFFMEYVHKAKPVVMKGAAKLSRAFERWTDEYFLSLDEPADNMVLVESRKKENRSAPAVDMSFKDFVKVYNETDQYMVNSIPVMVAADVILPGPLQCEPIKNDILVDSVMWFSSGGTKSVVHTDSVDNINCLFRGTKKLVMVDPEKYADMVDLDHPEGAYSDIDVDSVDFIKYPGLADVEYLHVNLEPGDCLYIPYKWIHQVRSYGSNIAVNIWWDYHLGMQVDLEECPDSFDPDLTMDKVEMSGFGEMSMTAAALRDHILDFTRRGAVDFGGFLKVILGDNENLDHLDSGRGYQKPLKKAFDIMDINGDNLVTSEEIDILPDEGWHNIEDHMIDFDEISGWLQNSFRVDEFEDEEDGKFMETADRDEL